MIGSDKIVVSINLGNKESEVGELLSTEGRIYFKYHHAFLDRGIEISPFKLKLSEEILMADIQPFDGLFGVFNDSLPDSWGRLLSDRTLSSKGISLNQITPLDRLAFVGSEGMGALCYKPELSSGFDHNKELELDSIALGINQVLQGNSYDLIEELFEMGGSSGGARPKIFVAYNPITEELIHDSEGIPEDFEHWIIKFPSSTDPVDIANIEFAYHKMALEAGIEMSECRLFKGFSGKQYFGTKRFDRINGNRLHMHSASGLMHDNFRLSSMDYGNLMDCAFRLENHITAYEKVLRLAVFNVFANNRDDHSKNFSFLMDQDGNWRLAPAYDLTFSYSSHGFHSTMVAGESKSPGKKQLLELAKHFSMKNPTPIIDKVRDAINSWSRFAKENGVEKESLNEISRTLL